MPTERKIEFYLNGEIRFATIPEESSLTFQGLKNLSIQVYPRLTNNVHFVLQYEDNERDLVTFSTNKELELGLEFFGDIWKFTIVESSPPESLAGFWNSPLI
jgi:hypothetical protein